MESPSHLPSRWRSTCISLRKQLKEITVLLAKSKVSLTCIHWLLAVLSCILREPLSTIACKTWFVSNIVYEATKRFYLQTFSISSYGKPVGTIPNIKKTYSYLKSRIKDLEWSLWTVLLIVSCSPMNWELTENYLWDLLTSEFFIETRLVEPFQD